MDHLPTSADAPHDELIRDFGLAKATALNMSNMIGIGPFITMNLILGAMGGPQAILGWIVGVLLAICDGMVWSELSAAMPGSGGSYLYLRECFGRERWGRFMAFMFIWQFLLSGPLEIASGAIGLSKYAAYPLVHFGWVEGARPNDDALGSDEESAAAIEAGVPEAWSSKAIAERAIAFGVSAVAVMLLYRRITAIGRLTLFLWLAMLGTVLFMIVSGLMHFDKNLIVPFPENAFHVDGKFLFGLGTAMGIAMYDYLGYYDVCYIGDEVQHPEKNIPRSIMISVVAVAVIYMTMNISFIGVIPWQEVGDTVATTFVEKLYGPGAACLITLFVALTAFASIFAMFLGYSRIPYAAARDGTFFSYFDHLHPKQKFPDRSLLVVGVITMLASLWTLEDVINAILACRILVQFVGQNAGLMHYRRTHSQRAMPFRMWLYPLPCWIAFAGWMFIFGSKLVGQIANPWYKQEALLGLLVIAAGAGIFLVWSARARQWPFTRSQT
ncbi:MAG TPA: APC family permease [Pirellulales bacterium]|nr:APC family permease [Pirellulales bacterium]